MKYTVVQTAGLVIACILGGFFIIMGVIEFLDKKLQASNNPIADFVLNVGFIIVGVLIWLATFFRYSGGIWSIAGAFLVAGALAGTVSIVEIHLRGGHYDSPVSFYTRIASCWIIGVGFLLMGHRRHRRKKQVLPDGN